MIHFCEKQKQFQINTHSTSYIFKINEFKHLEHVYWGKRIKLTSKTNTLPRVNRGYSTNYFKTNDRAISYDEIYQEISTFGNGDYREPAMILKNENGADVNDFVYESHTIKTFQKDNNQRHTTSHGQCTRLSITLKDLYEDVYLILHYDVFEKSNSITRFLELKNVSDQTYTIEKLMSFNIDMYHDNYDLLYLNGSWANERNIQREKIMRGIKKIDSKRGTSSHHFAPFFAILESDANEDKGSVYSFNFVYSGGFESIIENDSYDNIRVQMGIQSQTFSKTLNKKEKFVTPEVVMHYSEDGLNGMMHEHHRFVLNHIIPPKYKNTQRPILINNWEATYFNFDEDKILEMAKKSTELGIELFVLDDGWFGKRDSDNSSLGDWFVYKDKLPSGLPHLAQKIKAMGLKFGLWIEPEMISKNSKLYEMHPEYKLKVPNRDATPSRDQFVLDFSQKEVVDHIFNQIKEVFDETPLDYVKWDMNRNLTDVYSQISNTPDVYHEYMLGVYDLARRLLEAYPDILFEGCAGGGGRFDWGMLSLFPQIWTSDNTDAIERLNIQDGSVLLFPQSTMGAHVSAVPNHQVNRSTSLNTRFNVASAFNLGYELDVSQMSEEEIKTTQKHITWYKKHRDTLLYGQFYRLKSNEQFVWQVNTDHEVFLFITNVLAKTNAKLKKIKLKGLDEHALYAFDDELYSGSELMYHGLYISPTLNEDFKSQNIVLIKKEGKTHD